MYKNRKAVSPVIATVILVAVAITISVAVAYWMGGISSQYTKFEKVEVSSALVTVNPLSPNQWLIDVNLKNTGTSTTTITSAFINDRQVNDAIANGNAISDIPAGGLTIASGAADTITITIQKGTGVVGEGPFAALTAGTTVNLKFHSAGGMDYLKLVELI